MRAGGSLFLGAALLAAGQGGIARVARITARALIEGGYGVELLSLLDREPVAVAGVGSWRAGGSKARYLMMCQRMALRHARAIYDSVGTARAHPRLISPIPYALWLHGIEAWFDLHADRRRALSRADLVLVNSEFTLHKFQALHRRLDRARVCWLGTEDDAPPPARANFLGPPTALCVGRIDADQGYKGHAELIAAWPTVAAGARGARLVIAGGGTALEGMRALAKSSPAAAHIEVLGFVPEHRMAELWQSAHVFAMPSRGEGFGIVYAEAMRFGLPVVASVHDAGSEVNVDGVTGFNIDLSKRGELAEHLIELLTDPDAARRLGEAGHRRWLTHFRYAAFAARLNACLGDFLADASPTAAASAC